MFVLPLVTQVIDSLKSYWLAINLFLEMTVTEVKTEAEFNKIIGGSKIVSIFPEFLRLFTRSHTSLVRPSQIPSRSYVTFMLNGAVLAKQLLLA